MNNVDNFFIDLEHFCTLLPVTYDEFIERYPRNFFFHLIDFRSKITKLFLTYDFYEQYTDTKPFKKSNANLFDPQPYVTIADLTRDFKAIRAQIDFQRNHYILILCKFLRIVQQIEDSMYADRCGFHLYQRIMKCMPTICNHIGMNTLMNVFKKNKGEKLKLKCNCTINENTTVNATSTLDGFNKESFWIGHIGISFFLTFILEFVRVFTKSIRSRQQFSEKGRSAACYSLLQGLKVALNWNFTSFFSYIKKELLGYILPCFFYPLVALGIKICSDFIKIWIRTDVEDLILPPPAGGGPPPGGGGPPPPPGGGGGGPPPPAAGGGPPPPAAGGGPPPPPGGGPPPDSSSDEDSSSPQIINEL